MDDRAAVDSTMPRFRLDRSSPVPLYFQVARHLEEQINSGELPTGTLLQNEVDLAESLGLSRPTMRRAMQYLVDKGLVVRRRGIGTRVVQPKLRRPLELTSLYDDLASAGKRPTTAVLSVGMVDAGEDVASGLEIEVGQPVLEIVRLRSAEEAPIAKMTNYLPERLARFDADDLAAHSLYELMRGQGVTLHSATQTLGARNATAAEARVLDEPAGSALITAVRITYDDRGDPVEYGTHVYAASRYTFEIQLFT
jgi:DNA-binding GntR family transcriptional regulator